LPELPTIAEAGLPDYEMLNWLGMFAPAGTPRTVTEKLGREAIRVVGLPQVTKQFHAHGAEPSPLATDEFTAFVKSEGEKWSRVVKATGMKAN
jgi:tripartite-type tricarboxylate transporter receptor subunit TctC